MSEVHPTTPAPGGKAEKSHPFTLHKTGQYRKKVRGKRHYFGRDLDVALAK